MRISFLKSLTALGLILSLSVMAQAQKPAPEFLIQAADVSNVEYEAYLKVHASEYTPISEHFKSKREYEVPAATLQQLFDDAEKSFLSEPVEVAHDNYKKVAAVALKSDWIESERKLLFHAYLRCAQTAITELKRRQFLISAKQLDGQLKPDENLFPPPLVKEWLALAAQDAFKIVKLNSAFSQYRLAYINGQAVEFKRFVILVPKGDFRLTLISDSKTPLTKILNAESIQIFRPHSPAFVKGSCHEPKFQTKVSAAALFPGDCIGIKNAETKKKSDFKWTGYEEKKPAVSSETAVAENRLSTRFEGAERPFYRSGYFWTAAAAVTAILIYHDKQKEREGDTTTHKTGF